MLFDETSADWLTAFATINTFAKHLKQDLG